MKLKLNISPCPNDTFMFEALINQRIDTEGLDFDVSFYDIQELNERVLSCNSLDISKISYAILPKIVGSYKVLDSGSALGFGNGPLLVSSKKNLEITAQTRVVSPGENTTASMLLKKIFPEIQSVDYKLFSQIADSVCSGEYHAGVLIHEGRFTFRDKNLNLIADLGEKWEQKTGLALPLGAIVVNNNLSSDLQIKINRVLKRSIIYAMQNPQVSRDFVRSYAQELDDDVIDSHIKMFVNEFSVSLGERGRRAVFELCDLEDENIFVL